MNSFQLISEEEKGEYTHKTFSLSNKEGILEGLRSNKLDFICSINALIKSIEDLYDSILRNDLRPSDIKAKCDVVLERLLEIPQNLIKNENDACIDIFNSLEKIFEGVKNSGDNNESLDFIKRSSLHIKNYQTVFLKEENSLISLLGKLRKSDSITSVSKSGDIFEYQRNGKPVSGDMVFLLNKVSTLLK